MNNFINQIFNFFYLIKHYFILFIEYFDENSILLLENSEENFILESFISYFFYVTIKNLIEYYYPKIFNKIYKSIYFYFYLFFRFIILIGIMELIFTNLILGFNFQLLFKHFVFSNFIVIQGMVFWNYINIVCFSLFYSIFFFYLIPFILSKIYLFRNKKFLKIDDEFEDDNYNKKGLSHVYDLRFFYLKLITFFFFYIIFKYLLMSDYYCLNTYHYYHSTQVFSSGILNLVVIKDLDLNYFIYTKKILFIFFFFIEYIYLFLTIFLCCFFSAFNNFSNFEKFLKLQKKEEYLQYFENLTYDRKYNRLYDRDCDNKEISFKYKKIRNSISFNKLLNTIICFFFIFILIDFLLSSDFCKMSYIESRLYFILETHSLLNFFEFYFWEESLYQLDNYEKMVHKKNALKYNINIFIDKFNSDIPNYNLNDFYFKNKFYEDGYFIFIKNKICGDILLRNLFITNYLEFDVENILNENCIIDQYFSKIVISKNVYAYFNIVDVMNYYNHRIFFFFHFFVYYYFLNFKMIDKFIEYTYDYKLQQKERFTFEYIIKLTKLYYLKIYWYLAKKNKIHRFMNDKTRLKYIIEEIEKRELIKNKRFKNKNIKISNIYNNIKNNNIKLKAETNWISKRKIQKIENIIEHILEKIVFNKNDEKFKEKIKNLKFNLLQNLAYQYVINTVFFLNKFLENSYYYEKTINKDVFINNIKIPFILICNKVLNKRHNKVLCKSYNLDYNYRIIEIKKHIKNNYINLENFNNYNLNKYSHIFNYKNKKHLFKICNNKDVMNILKFRKFMSYDFKKNSEIYLENKKEHILDLNLDEFLNEFEYHCYRFVASDFEEDYFMYILEKGWTEKLHWDMFNQSQFLMLVDLRLRYEYFTKFCVYNLIIAKIDFNLFLNCYKYLYKLKYYVYLLKYIKEKIKRNLLKKIYILEVKNKFKIGISYIFLSPEGSRYVTNIFNINLHKSYKKYMFNKISLLITKYNYKDIILKNLKLERFIKNKKFFINFTYKILESQLKIMEKFDEFRKPSNFCNEVIYTRYPFFISFYVFNLILIYLLYLFSKKTIIFFIFLSFISILLFNSVDGWSKDMIIEGYYLNKYNRKIERCLAVGTLLFIISELMVFIGFFWVYLDRLFHTPFLFGNYKGIGIEHVDFWRKPLYATIVLVFSGYILTESLAIDIKENNFRRFIKVYLFTLISGIAFIIFQILEYHHILICINDSVTGSSFFLLTGFHGFHVIVGLILLLYQYDRVINFQYSSRNTMLGYNNSYIYWKFVDYVWIFLFGVVYIFNEYHFFFI